MTERRTGRMTGGFASGPGTRSGGRGVHTPAVSIPPVQDGLADEST
jgi:hypothetical protein